MKYLLSGLFGIILAICGLNVIEDPAKTLSLIVFYCVSLHYFESRGSV